jgi:transposase
MAQNRKYQAASVRFRPAVLALLLCLLIGGAGVGYVWQKSQISELGREFKNRERRLEDLQGKNKQLRQQLATLRSPLFLAQRVRELNLGLGPAQPGQILRLPEPDAWPAIEPAVTQFAVRSADAGP